MREVRFTDGSVTKVPESNLEPVPTGPPDLVEQFSNGRFVPSEWLRRALTRIRVAGRRSDIFYSMEATEPEATDFYAYQFKPVLKLLNSPTDALLIADEVGLGKTIEAGLIWTELRARLECNRLLVICPQMLREKWRIELDLRFGVDARIVDAEELLRLTKERGRTRRGFAAITGIHSIRPPKNWDTEDWENNPRRGDVHRRDLALYLRDEEDGEPLFDLLVVDEAHHMRNPKTLTHRLGQLTNGVSAHRTFLSATPIHLQNRDLHSLLRLIDPETFERQSTLEEMIAANEPVVAARDLLMRKGVSKEQIGARIEDARSHSLLTDSKALKLICRDLDRRPFDESTRAELAARLESVNQLANYVNRTRRRDVEINRVVRHAEAPGFDMTGFEKNFYEIVTEGVSEYARQNSLNHGFLLATPLRMLTSSFAAVSSYWSNYRESKYDKSSDNDEDSPSDKEDDRPLLRYLRDLARDLDLTADLEEVDTKFNELISYLKRLSSSYPKEKVIIFSTFIPTLSYLERRLREAGFTSEILHGKVRERRQDILDRFRDNEDVTILLSSEIGSEGVDLQFCSRIVNYDLPWNPMRLEQRIGRVDRLGQRQEKIFIFNMIYNETIDSEIYNRLYIRLKFAERALGEFESILGEQYPKMTRGMLDPNLSYEQRMDVINQTAQAIENRKLQEEELEQKAGALIQHGDYVLDKIKDRHERKLWIRGEDILIYIKDQLDRDYPGCRIEASPVGSDTFRIELSQGALADLSDFTRRRDIRSGTRLTRNDSRQRYRFTSSADRQRRRGVENIFHHHPLALFARELDERRSGGPDVQPVAASVSKDKLGFPCEPGIFVVGIRCWNVTLFGYRNSSMTYLDHAGVSVDTGESLNPDNSEALIEAVASEGRPLSNFAQDERLLSAATLLRERVQPEIGRLADERLERLRADVEDRAAITERGWRRHFEAKETFLMEQRDNLKIEADRLEITDKRHAQRLRALSKAREASLEKLQHRNREKSKQLEEQRKILPETFDLTFVLVEVTP